ncbi:MAG: TldD/PmbA family protein [Actinobacteria bacterium]|nr:TldD/PmbA family protein [Actinomycetota bacterium]
MKPDFESIDIALNELSTSGAAEADVVMVRERGLSIRVFDGRLEEFIYSDDRGLGLRGFTGNRMGRAYTSDFSMKAIGETAGHAMENAKVSPGDPDKGIPDGSLIPAEMRKGLYLGEDYDILSPELPGTPPAEKIELALGLEKRAREYDPRIRGVETAVYAESTADIVLANSNGFRSGYRFSVCYGYLMAIAEENGDSQTGFGFTAGHSFASLDPGQASTDASSRAVGLLGAKPVESQHVPVLLDNITSAEIIAAFSMAMSGEAVTKGRSFLADKLGEPVASSEIDIVDDGLMKGGFATAPFDGEGIATSKKHLIEKGTLSTFMHNCYTASRMGARTTGNAGRGSYSSRVGVSPTNIYIPAGTSSPEELRKSMDRGLEVIEIQGAHVGLNPVTGEISVGAKGFWVENGERNHAVREVTIAGTMEGLFKGITGIGNDLRFTPISGSIGAPSLLVGELAVSGK